VIPTTFLSCLRRPSVLHRTFRVFLSHSSDSDLVYDRLGGPRVCCFMLSSSLLLPGPLAAVASSTEYVNVCRIMIRMSASQ
jgi:DNA-directed RNA polymerase subunit N (RpoN/RPB10)